LDKSFFLYLFKFIFSLNKIIIKRKKSIFMALLGFGVATIGIGITNSADAEAKGEASINNDKWICCQSMSNGCVDMDGNIWPNDYKYYGFSCGC